MTIKGKEISVGMDLDEVRKLLGDPDGVGRKSRKYDGLSTWKYLTEGQNWQIMSQGGKVYDISLRENNTGDRLEFETEEGYFVRKQKE